MRLATVLFLATACLGFGSAASAQGPYDGTYIGQTTSTQPNCSPAATHLYVENGNVYFGVNRTPGGRVGGDGSFAYDLRSARGLPSHTEARISNGVVEGQTIVPGECTWRYHATKVADYHPQQPGSLASPGPSQSGPAAVSAPVGMRPCRPGENPSEIDFPAPGVSYAWCNLPQSAPATTAPPPGMRACRVGETPARIDYPRPGVRYVWCRR